MIKVTNSPDNSIHVLDMEDGQVAEILSDSRPYSGVVVQRYKERLIALGKHSGEGWPNLFEAKRENILDFRVRILPKGTTLTIC